MDFAASALQFKSIDDTGTIEGLLAGFGNVDSHGDVIERGAFAKTLAERGDRPLPMLLHHDLKRPIGAWRSWEETDAGLYVKGDLTLASSDAREAHALAKAGALTGLSIGFTTRREQRSGGANRLTEINLHEGSLVAVPSNPKTHVAAVKAIVGARDIEELLRDGGLSARRAKAAAGAAWRALNEPDDGDGDAAAIEILNASAARIAAMGGNR